MATALNHNVSKPGARPSIGWGVLHLFYHIDYAQLGGLSNKARSEICTPFLQWCQTWNQNPEIQLHTYSVLGNKADLGIMLLGPDLHLLNQAEADLLKSSFGGLLKPAYSFVSLTELGEYMTSEEEFGTRMQEQEGLSPESEDYQSRMAAFSERMEKYRNDKLYPLLPPWPNMCFYPMNKARGEKHNWYNLPFAERKKYMGGHARIGQLFAGKILQLVTGSTGLDDWEWGVTLLAKDPVQLKEIVYQMRFDEVSALFGEFGPFYTCLRLEPAELLHRLVFD